MDSNSRPGIAADAEAQTDVATAPVKRYFFTLDAMRGVAAIGVVVFHLQGLFAPYGLPHGYLAVDFFFALSGLVISRAYAARFRQGLSLTRFLVLRIARLYPLYILGTAMGFVVLLVPFYWHPALRPPAPVLIVSELTALVMLPSPLTFGSQSWLTPFNIAAWSLVLELVINMLFAAVWKWLTRRTLAAIIVVSGILLVIFSLRFGSLAVGAVWPTLYIGLIRTCFSFFVGVAIGKIPVKTVKVSAFALLLPTALIVTLMPGAEYGAIYDLGCALVLYPALLFLGARFEAPGTTVLRFLGSVSYPIYVIHEPLLYIFAGYAVKHGSPTTAMRHASALVVVVVVIVIATLAEVFYDRPIRDWLARRIKSNNRPAAPAD